MPLAGRLRAAWHVPGRLFSVNSATVARVPGLFARNERVVCAFDGESRPVRGGAGRRTVRRQHEYRLARGDHALARGARDARGAAGRSPLQPTGSADLLAAARRRARPLQHGLHGAAAACRRRWHAGTAALRPAMRGGGRARRLGSHHAVTGGAVRLASERGAGDAAAARAAAGGDARFFAERAACSRSIPRRWCATRSPTAHPLGAGTAARPCARHCTCTARPNTR